MLTFLSVGVNRGLRFAEVDAARLALFLKWSAATKRAVTGYLENAAWKARRIETLLLFFSGHGSELGLRLHDDHLSYRELGVGLRGVGAKRTILVLDTCHAGAGRSAVAGIDEGAQARQDHIRAMLSAVPGMRLLAGSAGDQLSRESPGVGGHFTTALLSALETTPGDITYGATSFISDRAALRAARCYMIDRWGAAQTPVHMGPIGDFPLSRAQDTATVGSAHITSIVPLGGSTAQVSIAFLERRLVPSNVRMSLLAPDGRPLALSDVFSVMSTRPLQSLAVNLFGRPLSSAASVTLKLHARLRIPIRWHVEVLDNHGAAIEQGEVRARIYLHDEVAPYGQS